MQAIRNALRPSGASAERRPRRAGKEFPHAFILKTADRSPHEPLPGVAAGAAIAAPSPSSGASDIVPVIPDPLSGKEEQVTKLPNGLSVLILKDTRFPLVSTRLYVHAGSSYETPDQAGISHVLEHMVFKGTDSRPKSAISQEVESAGGYLNAATSYDYTVYITDMPDRHWKLGMDVVRDMAFHPTLDPQELESEKNVIVAELQRGEDRSRAAGCSKPCWRIR